MDHVKYCPVCGFVYCYLVTLRNKNQCRECHSNLIDTGKTLQEFYTELNTKEPEYVQKYIGQKYIYIKENKLYDPIKENIRLKEDMKYSEYVKTLEQKQIETSNIPHCPTCGSTNIEKISGVNKVGSAALFGVFSLGHISKTFRCKNCGMKF